MGGSYSARRPPASAGDPLLAPGPDPPGATNPDLYAEITACARSRTPSLAGTALMWDFTASAPTAAARAISR
ncbi:hypothetical protein QF035_008672 [Streptomyces umbrinus]|uniref:Uncharacterized protein n=1 Tax=Streptomyces umbrinus TaxID=67370 RepID=A0ABU0T5J9_9ACTN|nr:hypothetical protein [Streptomyces umbrinus]